MNSYLLKLSKHSVKTFSTVNNLKKENIKINNQKFKKTNIYFYNLKFFHN